MKKFLVWCERPGELIHNIIPYLKEKNITYCSNVIYGVLSTNNVSVKFTHDEKYIEQDGLFFDEIFVQGGCFPSILRHRTHNTIKYISPLEHTYEYLADKITKAHCLEAVIKNGLNSIYGTMNTDSLFVTTYNPYRDNKFIEYCENNVKTKKELWNMFFSNKSIPKIKNVIFNDPATIVFWSDGTKTVVKCQDDDWYDPEKGLAMAISKKALGNKGNYCNEIKKWLPEEELIDWCGDLFELGNEFAKGIMDGLCKAKTTPELTINNFNNDAKHKETVQKVHDLLNDYVFITGETPKDKIDKLEALITDARDLLREVLEY